MLQSAEVKFLLKSWVEGVVIICIWSPVNVMILLLTYVKSDFYASPLLYLEISDMASFHYVRTFLSLTEESPISVCISCEWLPCMCAEVFVCVIPSLWLASPMGWAHAHVGRAAGSCDCSFAVAWAIRCTPVPPPEPQTPPPESS